MDTDSLSKETYEAVIIEAEKLTHDLTLRFGVLAARCNNEAEYLEKSRQLALSIKELEVFRLEDLFFGNAPDIEDLKRTLNRILRNIEDVTKNSH